VVAAPGRLDACGRQRQLPIFPASPAATWRRLATNHCELEVRDEIGVRINDLGNMRQRFPWPPTFAASPETTSSFTPGAGRWRPVRKPVPHTPLQVGMAIGGARRLVGLRADAAGNRAREARVASMHAT